MKIIFNLIIFVIIVSLLLLLKYINEIKEHNFELYSRALESISYYQKKDIESQKKFINFENIIKDLNSGLNDLKINNTQIINNNKRFEQKINNLENEISLKNIELRKKDNEIIVLKKNLTKRIK